MTNINEWTEKTDIEHEERLELGLPIKEDNLHPLFKQIIEDHLIKNWRKVNEECPY